MVKPKLTEQSVFFLLEKTSKAIRDKIGSYLKNKRTDVTTMQWICLESIHYNLGLTQKQLSALLTKEEASISRILKKLSDKRYIFRKKSNKDNKTQNLYLSPDGVELLKTHQKSVNMIYKDTFSSIYDREMNLVHEILKRLNT